ncbi:MAG: hypothetical protein AAF721_14485, partial [Myxococcota bacterium]
AGPAGAAFGLRSAQKRVSCIRRTELIRLSDDRVVCQAATTWAFVTTDSGRPCRIPPDVRAAFEPANGT